jgi:cob(I)alamin adenosyltransferase
VKKSKIYTRTGDLGETGLVSGNRTLKSDSRIDLYGDLDELNSRVGMSVAHVSQDLQMQKVLDFLHHIQSALFDLGSNLACEVENRQNYKLPQIPSEFIVDMEQEIDRMDSELEPLKNFILPGGSHASASIHLCRTGARSVERKLIAYHHATKEALPENSLTFLNRLSDYFFVLARYVNLKQGGKEIFWKPLGKK